MSEAIKDYTPSKKIKRPSYSLVAKWVKESWDAVDPNMIMRSFKCCGISNAIDGTEDNLIFDFNKVESVNNPRRGVEEDNEDDDDGSDDSYSESDESESDDSSGSESDDSSELGDVSDDYYKENEESNVIQDWN
jgi:hypothetical protein